MSILCGPPARTKPEGEPSTIIEPGLAVRPPADPDEQDLAQAWAVGFYTGRHNLSAVPRSHWPEPMKAAFCDGQCEGERARDEALAWEAESVFGIPGGTEGGAR